MAFTVEELQDAPIIIITLTPPTDIAVEPAQTSELGVAFQKKMGGTVARIMDYRKIKLTFGDVAQGMATDVAFRNPNIKTFIVGTDALVKMAGEAFKQEQYGKVNIPVFADRDEAIEAARKALQ